MPNDVKGNPFEGQIHDREIGYWHTQEAISDCSGAQILKMTATEQREVSEALYAGCCSLQPGSPGFVFCPGPMGSCRYPFDTF